MVFNNKQLEEIIEKMPQTEDELLSITGLGKGKLDKYGDDILAIIMKYYMLIF